MFEKFLNPQIRDTLMTDMLSMSSDLNEADNDEVTWNENVSRSLPDSLYCALRASLSFDPPRKAPLLSHIKKHGATYAVRGKHEGNSYILVETGAGNVAVPARIEYIVQLQAPARITTYVAIRRYKPAKILDDPFAPFPVLRTRLWSTDLASLEIITVDLIHAHFAQLLVKWEDTEVAIVSSTSREY